MPRHLLFAITLFGVFGVFLNSSAKADMGGALCENQAANCVENGVASEFRSRWQVCLFVARGSISLSRMCCDSMKTRGLRHQAPNARANSLRTQNRQPANVITRPMTAEINVLRTQLSHR
jgi:hypothetical protein